MTAEFGAGEHNHFTRDIQPEGQCPMCDRSYAVLVTRPSPEPAPEPGALPPYSVTYIDPEVVGGGTERWFVMGTVDGDPRDQCGPVAICEYEPSAHCIAALLNAAFPSPDAMRRRPPNPYPAGHGFTPGKFANHIIETHPEFAATEEGRHV